MNVIEQFSEGKKGDPALNEDRIIVTDDFIAVLDGVTDKTGIILDDQSTGRFAVDVVAGVIEGLPAEIDFRGAIDAMSEKLATEIRAAYIRHGIEITENMNWPSLVLVMYSATRKEIWRMGDGGYAIDGMVSLYEKEIDAAVSNARSLRLEMAVRAGSSLDDLKQHDVGRDLIEPLLKYQYLFENIDAPPYGYGCLNGTHIPDCFLQVMDAAEAREVILCSDGYPVIKDTLSATEQALTELLRDDPLLFQQYKTTKGLMTGQVSFDDRSYIRFTP